ncbi:MAG: ATP-binding protein, partial [Pseudomonadota bacterium]
LKQSDYVCLSFEDTGPGFSSIDLEQAFAPFYTRNRHTGGSGLGLSMVKGFTQQAGGDTFISNGEYGAKVEIFLPAAELKRTLLKSDELKQQNNYSGLKDVYVLLVEDNDEFGKMLSNLLKAYCADVVYVQTVSAARKALYSNKHINFVVSDFLLPDGEGSEIVRLTRILDRDISSFYISGYLDKQIEDPLEKATVLRKPFTLDELMSKLDEMHNVSDVHESS